MKRRIPRVNTEVVNRDFKYYIFDWDDNILHMPTRIRLEHLEEDGCWKPVEVSTSTFALVRSDTKHYRAPLEGGWAAAFANFEDPAEESLDDRNNRFILDTVDALEKVLSEEEREEMMSNLRGYRQWIDGVADDAFGSDAEELDYYLGMCRYAAVTNRGFKERMANDPIYREKLATATTAARPELAKEFAIRDFVEHVFHMLRRAGQLGRSVSIGFSDDDIGNVKTVSSYIKEELSKRFEGIKFVVYDTSDRTLSCGRKVCVSGQLNLPGF